ncbi:cytochrome c [Rhodopseudomonas sp. B29]|uniref:c-type cytochrome n=1 Tax=Rhodopseudomonas sp. B29 TaxID=95607 RepID=UPI0006869531|nr:cytochrome c [Rhodopseudomonas sp. B29]
MSRVFLMLPIALLLCATGPARAGDNVDYLYRLHCSGCHGLDGLGSKVGRIPPFPGIVGHFADLPEGRLYLVQVPGVANAALPDAETAALLNYVLQTWGEAGKPAPRFTTDEVHQLRKAKVDDIATLRQALENQLARRNVSVKY